MTVTLLDVFSPPPTDGSVALNVLIDYNTEKNAENEFAVLVNTKEQDGPPTRVSYWHLGRAAHRVARSVNPRTILSPGTRMAILTSADTIVNVALVLGIMRAGLVPFPISPRVSSAGICHLLVSTDTHHAIVGGGSAIFHLVDSVMAETERIGHHLQTIVLPTFEELFLELAQPGIEHDHQAFPSLEHTGDDSAVAILHSSGSTGLPRAVCYTQSGLLANFVNQPPCWQMGGPGVRVGLMAAPTFHVMGFVTQCLFPQYAGYTLALFAPRSTPVIPSSEVTLQTIVKSRCEFLLTVPTFLEVWSREPHAIRVLRGLKGIVYAGGPLTQRVGDFLVKQGILLRTAYGSTELGCPALFNFVQRTLEDWSYVEFPEWTHPMLVPQKEVNTFELVMMSTSRHKPFVINYHVNGEPGYATKDLVVPHPTKLGLLRFVGRVDDQITLANGEKTNPVPMETEIIKCPIVQAAIMFGRERNQTGVLIELDHSNLDRASSLGSRYVFDQVWLSVDKANKAASTHSYIAREAILFCTSDRPLLRTPKGTIARAGSLDLYKDEISAMYSRIEHGVSPTPETSVAWRDHQAVESWLGDCVEGLLHRRPDVIGDLFQQGLDSLSATLLLRQVKENMFSASDIQVRRASEKLTQQTIFGHPTIQQLAAYLLGLLKGESSAHRSTPSGSYIEYTSSIGGMVEKYTQGLDFGSPAWGDSSLLECVVLTGTTGGLGSHILALLLENDNVKRVWAFNRVPKGCTMSTVQRQRLAFEEKTLNVRLIDHPKLCMLDVNLLDRQLGLPQEYYDNIQNSVTMVIHNAWQVDFNLNIRSFEPSICGTRNLLNLASKRAPRFVFTSSISAAGLAQPGQICPEEYITDSRATAGFGYGQSKYVAERILEIARSAGLQTCVIRLGQLSGDSTSGAWSKTNWFPSLLASSVVIGRLPDAVGTVSWVPLDTAAKILLDVCQSPNLPPVVHVIHPRRAQWSSVMGAAADAAKAMYGQDLPFATFDEWNRLVTQAAASCDPASARQRFPSTTIQAAFDAMAQADVAARKLRGEFPGNIEALGVASLQTSVCESISPSLRALPAINREDVFRWMNYWDSKGLFVKERSTFE